MLSDFLSEQDIATMTNRLQVPLIVSDILSDEGMLSDDVQMGLHEVLSDDQPDSALLSIALSAKMISNAHHGLCASMHVLSMDCDRVIAEYGPMWIKNAQAKTLDDTMVFETLVHIPEDLESLAELLDLCAIALGPHDTDIDALCKVMSTQARAQAMIAETFLESMEMVDENPWDMIDDIDPAIAENALHINDNVIPFPGCQRVN